MKLGKKPSLFHSIYKHIISTSNHETNAQLTNAIKSKLINEQALQITLQGFSTFFIC